MNTEELKSLILNYQEPFVIKHILNWNMLDWNLEKWSEVLDEEKMEFRCGKYKYTLEPQWERDTKLITKTFNEFSKFNIREEQQWLYFDYKYLSQNLKNKHILHNSISWEKFGFPEFNAEESTLWIGSEGAHTPCHKDTYGCNLVAQIYGSKRWIIFPPEEDLCSTRIPYEESSIYSKLNFFCPNNIERFKSIKNSKSIILKAGDVLFVPNGWWHYVENLEIAISINVWIPLSIDPHNQLKESLVQMFISQMLKGLSKSNQENILNPNMEKLNLQTQCILQSLEVISVCKSSCMALKSEFNPFTDFEKTFQRNQSNLQKIPNLSNDDLINLLQSQAKRFENDDIEEKLSEDNLKNIINAFVNGDVIDLIAQKLLNTNKNI